MYCNIGLKEAFRSGGEDLRASPPPLMRVSIANVSKVSTAKHLSPPVAGKAAGELICELCRAGEPLRLLFVLLCLHLPYLSVATGSAWHQIPKGLSGVAMAGTLLEPKASHTASGALQKVERVVPLKSY